MKYRINYSNLIKDINGGFSEKSLQINKDLYDDIISLMEETHIECVYIFAVNDITYILIGEDHSYLENDNTISFAKIYNKILNGTYENLYNLDVFVESQINLTPNINTNNFSDYKIESNERTLDAVRRITTFKPINNNLNINPYYIDIRDNSLYFWLNLAKNMDIPEKKKEIIQNIFILLCDNYIRYSKLLISTTEIKDINKKNHVKRFEEMVYKRINYVDDKIDEINIDLIEKLLDDLDATVIDPYTLAKIYSTDSNIKILYGGTSHVKPIYDELIKQNNVISYFYSE